MAVLLLGLALTAVTAAAGQARSPVAARRASIAPLGGVNVFGLFNGSTLISADREIAQARALHASVVRAEVRWSTLEPLSRGQIDQHALAFTDRLVSDAAAARIGVIMTVDDTPCWASSAPTDVLRRCVPVGATAGSSPGNAWPPSRPADYGAVVGYLAARYGSHLAAIEVWNEPDQGNQLYFAGPHKPQRYAAILRAAYPAIKRADRSLPVLAGSLVGSKGDFLRALYAAGIKGYYDGLAVHFYNLVLGSVRAIREVQLANGDSKPLWLDEFGWSSCYPRRRIQEEQACVTARTQASNLADTVRALAEAPYVAARVVYDLQNSGTEDFGLMTAAGQHKPAFAALSRALAAPFLSPSPVTVSLRTNRGRLVASGSAPVGDFMQLEAFAGALPLYRALFTLNRFNRYSIALPSVLGTRGLTVRVYQYWAGSAKAAQAGV